MTMPLILGAEPSNGILAKNLSTNAPIARSPVELLANSRAVIAEACAATSASARCCAVISTYDVVALAGEHMGLVFHPAENLPGVRSNEVDRMETLSAGPLALA
jgi:hypothetical protein